MFYVVLLMRTRLNRCLVKPEKSSSAGSFNYFFLTTVLFLCRTSQFFSCRRLAMMPLVYSQHVWLDGMLQFFIEPDQVQIQEVYKYWGAFPFFSSFLLIKELERLFASLTDPTFHSYIFLLGVSWPLRTGPLRISGQEDHLWVTICVDSSRARKNILRSLCFLDSS